MIRSSVALSLILLYGVPLPAQNPAPALTPGEYGTEGGWGTLTLTRGTSGALHFSIETYGGNGHSCSLEGEVHDGVAMLEVQDEGTCRVTLKAGKEGVHVAADREACRGFCGARAGFTTLYFRLPTACATKAVARTRRAFQRLYDQKKFAKARTTLEPLLAACERWLEPQTVGRVRNDLAVTMHKLGDLEACRQVLEPLAEDASLTDEELRETYSLTDEDSQMSILRATRTNLKLCRRR